LGFQVLGAHTPENALFRLALNQPDLVIIDFSRPGIDAWETLRRIRELSRAPVIVLTTLDEVGVVESTLEVGADDVVTMPCDPRELEARARALLRRRQMAAQPPLDIPVGPGPSPTRRL
jgi:DNA-binding response OmpR family regulator